MDLVRAPHLTIACNGCHRTAPDHAPAVFRQHEKPVVVVPLTDLFLGWLPAEVVEYSCNIAPDLMGDFVENVATGMDTYSIRQPLGVSSCVSANLHPSHQS